MSFNKKEDWNYISTDDTCGTPTTHLTNWGCWLYNPGPTGTKGALTKEELAILKAAYLAVGRKLTWGTGWQTGMASLGPGKFADKADAIALIHQLETLLPTAISSKLHIKFFAYGRKAKKNQPPTTPGGFWA